MIFDAKSLKFCERQSLANKDPQRGTKLPGVLAFGQGAGWGPRVIVYSYVPKTFLPPDFMS